MNSLVRKLARDFLFIFSGTPVLTFVATLVFYYTLPSTDAAKTS